MPLYLGEEQISDLIIAFDGSGVSTGTDTSDATLATGAQMLSPYTAYSNGKKYTGTIATVEAPTPSISVSTTGLVTASVTNPKGYQSSEKNTSATTQLTTQGTKTITPNDSTQIAVDSGVYTTGATTVSAVPTETKKITANGTYSPSTGKYFSSVEVAIAGDAPTYQSKTVSPSATVQTVTADSGYDALSDVTVNAIQTEIKSITPTTSAQIVTPTSGKYLTEVSVGAIQTETKSITSNGTYTPTSGKWFSSVSVNVAGDSFNTQTKSVTPTESEQTVTPDAGYDGLSSVTVGAISSTYIGSGVAHKSVETYTPTENAQTISAGQYLDGDQTIAAISSTYIGSGVTRKETATITPSESEQTIAANQYLTGVQTISAIPSDYVGSDVIRKSAATITPNESEQVISAGQYLDGAQTISAIPSTYVGSGVPTQDTVTITPNTSAQTAVSAGTYVTGDVLVAEIPENYVDTSDANAASSDMVEGVTAYINGEKKTGTMPSLVGNSNVVFSTSIKQPISVNGFTQDVYIHSDAVTENMYVPSGDVVTITIPVTRREEVLGNVQASEVLAGKTFISNSNITTMNGYTAMIGTGTMPSKDAATFTPGTTDQTIDAGQYLSGAQTIQGDANLVPENIISGKSIFGVSGSVVIQKYYTGATEPSSSLGNDGDLYFKA